MMGLVRSQFCFVSDLNFGRSVITKYVKGFKKEKGNKREVFNLKILDEIGVAL